MYIPVRVWFAGCLAARLLWSATGLAVESTSFTPTHTLPGLGASRLELDEVTLSQRIEDMIQSQTFGILRDPRAVSGAQRISSPKMQKIFRDAEHKSGVPASLLAAIAYVESFGDPRAESPSGPRGIVQISEATARRIGLKVARARRYKVT
ncbi:MAG TPA: transglycosylase SLT domain-containing protein, partial [Bryobacteraceae bacterium]|nr:transglycosylase SLT domain-containing protein [Bryobacteraceae bacterium]